MILAQLNTVPAEHGWQTILVLLGIFGAVATGVGMWAALQKGRRDAIDNRDAIPRKLTPDPLRVEAVPRYVTPDQCASSHSAIIQRVERVETDLEGLRIEVREVQTEARHDRERNTSMILEETGKVHNRVNDVLQAVSELRGELRARFK